ncbi:MAG: glycerol-3-phosphate acyltransferase [Candidatus Marinimicrobia bacterium]|nr:glycerol-3-phosphate acyltransferase [Candidatus Neomarinimicrobiota bacterium]MDD5709494.1 glycerol-3-phosphate acyltransferase [Candidatus Neomarinimicrobiota bacterium]
MFYLILVGGMLCAYLSGSVSYARIFARLGKGVDITHLGNGNPGTSNVMRNVGKFWGTLTLLGDALKGSLVMMLFKALFFSPKALYPVEGPFAGAGFAAIVLIGIAAIYGHGYPVFYRFRGGGSIGVLFGCWLFLIYPQFLIHIVIAYMIVKLFLRKQKYPMGRMTPLVFLILTPLLTLLESLLIRDWHPLYPQSLLFDHIGWGNHFLQFDGNGWLLIAGLFLFSLSVIPTNLSLLKNVILPGKGKIGEPDTETKQEGV